jgi:hypothetical protein
VLENESRKRENLKIKENVEGEILKEGRKADTMMT